MAEMLDPKNADKRTAARYIQMGLLDEKGYEKHVKGLPDVAEKGAAIDTVMDDVDFDDEDDVEAEAEAEA